MTFAGQVVHVFRKDVERYWPALVGVGVLMGVHRTVDLPSLGRWIDVFRGPVPVFGIIFALLTAVVVQDQRVAGDDPFWGTRPLSGLAVLLGKSFFVGLFLGLVPVAVHTQWLLALAGAGDASGVFAESLIYQMGFLAIVAAGAAVTREITAFLALAVVFWVGTELLGTVVGTGDVVFTDRGLEQTREYLERWGWLLIGSSVLVHQYTSRHTLRSDGIGLALTALVTVALAWSSVDLTEYPWEPDDRFGYQGGLVDVQITNLRYDDTYGGSPIDEPAAMLHALVTPTVDQPVAVTQRLARSRLLGSGIDYSYDFRPDVGFRGRTLFDPRLLVDGIPPAGLRPDRIGRLNPFSIRIAETTPEEMRELRRTTRIETRLDLDVYRLSVVDRIPLEAGRSARLEGGIVELEAIHRSSRGVNVSVTYREILGPLKPYGSSIHVMVSLYSPRYGEYLRFSNQGSTSGPAEPVAPSHYIVGGSSIVGLVRRFDFVDEPFRSDRWEPVPPDWFDDAEVIIVRPEYLGSVRKTLTTAVDSLPESGRHIRIDPGGP